MIGCFWVHSISCKSVIKVNNCQQFYMSFPLIHCEFSKYFTKPSTRSQKKTYLTRLTVLAVIENVQQGKCTKQNELYCFSE